MREAPTHAREWSEDTASLEARLHLAEMIDIWETGWSFCLFPRRDPERDQTLSVAVATPEETCWLTPRMLAELGELRMEIVDSTVFLKSPCEDLEYLMDEPVPGFLIKIVQVGQSFFDPDCEWTLMAASGLYSKGLFFTPEPDMNIIPAGWPR